MASALIQQVVDEDRCAVEGCPNQGRPQVCPYDGRYHHHGRIHYENGHRLHPEMKFRPIDDGGWRGMCDFHYQLIEPRVRAGRGW